MASIAPPAKKRKVDLVFQGCRQFRQRIICSTLSGKSIRIDEIRADDENPGLTDYEVNFLRLIEKVTNGCAIQINETGTSLRYRPGFVIGGSRLEHDCCPSRSIGYYLEGLLCLAPFGKSPLEITLRGVTNDNKDIPIDLFRVVTARLMKNFGIEEGLDIKIKKRGCAPMGGGEVSVSCPIVRELKPVQLLDEGKFKRIRGIAYTCKVSPSVGSRLVTSARGVFNHLIPDVYIYSDHYKGKDCGQNPGFGVSVCAESTTGVLLSTHVVAEGPTTPEDLGKYAAELLCEEVKLGGCVDTSHQSMALLYMALCPEDVSRVRFGKLSPYTIDYLRHLKDFFGLVFKIRPDPETHTVILSCLGTGFKNFAKRSA